MIYSSLKLDSHEHNLTQQKIKTAYKCDGCKEPGWGTRYRCEDCNYDLHRDCALPSATLSHSFYKHCTFKFLERGSDNRFCDACGKDVLGFVYHCYKTGHDLHPCCASLPHTLQADGVELHLRESISEKCGKCFNKKLWGNVRGWSYRSKNKEYHFHVSCVKEAIAERRENGHLEEVEMNDLGMEITSTPNFLITGRSSASSSRANKYWKIAKVVLNLIISIVTGNPAAGLVWVMGSLLSQ